MAASVTQKVGASFALQESIRTVFSASETDAIPIPDDHRSNFAPAVCGLAAGGQSTRMGTDKSALRLGDRPLGMWPAQALSGVSAVRVQLGGDPIPGLGWSVLADLRPECGPGGGIESGLAAFPGAALVVCAIDVPFVPTSLLASLLARLAGGHIAVVPHHRDRWHPLCAAYSPAFLPPLRDWLDAGRRDLQRLLDDAGALRVVDSELGAYGDPRRMLHNINTPDDLEAARTHVSGAELP